MFFKFLTVFIFQFIFVCNQEVHTKFGKIKGEQKINEKGGTPLYVFLGIPYAIQPLGDLRFKDPQPLPESYRYQNGLFEAVHHTRCVQYLPTIKKVIGQEDCLHLNIYTTTLDNEAHHDVVVFIHGGAFSYGAGHSQSPEYLLEHNQNLVFVSINYRLGPFGFMSTDDDVVPGNMGLKDQVIALEWVKNNIVSFGGNPGNIVIAGMSAGGVSVHLHFLSPMSKDFFTKGISMSGVALSRLVKSKNIKEEFENFAKLFPSCMNEGSTLKIVNCLSTIPPFELIKTFLAHKHPWEDYNNHQHFGPVIEKSSVNPFLDEHPFHLFRKGKVKSAPWLVSATTAEGIFPAGNFVDNLEKMEVLDQNWNSIAPYLLDFKEFGQEKDLAEISDRVRKHYFHTEPISFQNRNKLIRLVGDRLHMTSIENSLRLHATVSRSNIYMYMFDYRGKHSFSTYLSRTDSNLGVSHTDDLIYLLKMPYFDPHTQDRPILDMMKQIWSSFIKDGTPEIGNSIHWPSVSKTVTYEGNIDYVLIQDEERTKVTSSSDFSERRFWDSLPLDELHMSGNLYIPKYIQDLQKSSSCHPSMNKFEVSIRLHQNPLIASLFKKINFLNSDFKK